MNKIIILFLLTSTVLTAEDPIDILKSNKWISDKEQTMKWINRHNPKMARLEEHFGKMSIEYLNDKTIIEFDGDRSEKKFKLIGQVSDEIAFITYDEFTKKDVIVHLIFDDDMTGYWIYNNIFNVREHFIILNMEKSTNQEKHCTTNNE